MHTPIPSSPHEMDLQSPPSVTTSAFTSPPPSSPPQPTENRKPNQPRDTSKPHPHRALIIIDLQNEFLSPLGNFPISDLCRAPLIANLTTLIPQFRKTPNSSIIWVRAVYPHRSTEPAEMAAQEKGTGVVGNNEWLINATHVHPTACCAEGTFGAEIFPEVYALSQPEDAVVTKEWYSAFHGEKGKEFQGMLREKGVQEVWFCGVASGTCVLASVVDAVRISGGKGEGEGEERWKVGVVPECMGWRRENTHVEALRRFEQLGVEIVDVVTLVGELN